MKKTVIVVISLIVSAVLIASGTYYCLFKSAYKDMPEIAKAKVVIELSKNYKKGNTAYYADKKNLTYSISKTKSGYIVEIGGWANHNNYKCPLYAKVKFNSRCGFEKIEKLYI